MNRAIFLLWCILIVFTMRTFARNSTGNSKDDTIGVAARVAVGNRIETTAGNSGGNGGETVGLHFTESAQIAYQWIKDNENRDWIKEINDRLKPLSLKEVFYESIIQSKIEVVEEKLFLDKYEKVAINFPDKKLIQINRDLWLSSTKAEQIAISAHEHFGIIGIDDSNYCYSSQIIKTFTRGRSISDVAVIAGRPNLNVGGIDQIVDQNVILNPEAPDQKLTTRIYSILKMQSIQSVANVQILDQNGQTSTELILQAINKSVQMAPIVILPIGPMTELICTQLSLFTQTVFLLPPGNDAKEFEPPLNCLKDHILFVAPLNKNNTDLPTFSNFGNHISVAAPGTDIPVWNEEGHAEKGTSGTYAAVILASAIVDFAQNNPQMFGAKLSQSFLDAKTVVLPSLSGKVKKGRALLLNL